LQIGTSFDPFELRITQSDARVPRMWLENFDGSYAAMLNFFPDLSWNSSGTPELILVADCSASMTVGCCDCLIELSCSRFFSSFVFFA
jgi:hypothetical protein